MTNHLKRSFLSLVPLLGAVAACGGGDPNVPLTPGSSILARGAGVVIVESHGGGLPPVLPTGAGCDPQKFRYTLNVSTGDLAWTRCHVAQPATSATDFTPVSGARTLPVSERAAAEAAAEDVKVSGREICGADKPDMTVEVRHAGESSIVYGDDFYSCTTKHTHYVESEGLDALAALLTTLAHD